MGSFHFSNIFLGVLGGVLFLSSGVGAQGRATKSETYRDIIAKAQNLALQKDRQQAMNILVNAILKETSKTAASGELKKCLTELETLFFSDKTQQLYEVAVTLKRTDVGQALQKVGEAQRIEPDNGLLLLEQARDSIAKGDCSAAEEAATKGRTQNPYNEEMNLVFAQANLCLSRPAPPQKIGELAEIKKSVLAKFWLLLDVEKNLKEKTLSKAAESLLAAKKIDAAYPEIDYWQWKIDSLNKKKNPIAIEKYTMTCKNISAHLYRQYMADPLLCRRMGEMESTSNE